MLENIRGDSWGSILPLRMPSLLPHDLCHEWNASPAPRNIDCLFPLHIFDLVGFYHVPSVSASSVILFCLVYCVKVAFSECSNNRHPPVSPWHLKPKPEAQHPVPTHCCGSSLWAASQQRSAIQQWFLWWILSGLPSEPPLTPLHSTLSFQSSQSPWWGFLVCRNFSSFTTPLLRAQVPVLKSFVSFHVFTFFPASF